MPCDALQKRVMKDSNNVLHRTDYSSHFPIIERHAMVCKSALCGDGVVLSSQTKSLQRKTTQPITSFPVSKPQTLNSPWAPNEQITVCHMANVLPLARRSKMGRNLPLMELNSLTFFFSLQCKTIHRDKWLFRCCLHMPFSDSYTFQQTKGKTEIKNWRKHKFIIVLKDRVCFLIYLFRIVLWANTVLSCKA